MVLAALPAVAEGGGGTKRANCLMQINYYALFPKEKKNMGCQPSSFNFSVPFDKSKTKV